MQEFNVIALLQKYSADLALTGICCCLVSVFLKNSLNLSKKQSLVISFLLGVLSYILIGKIFLNIDVMILLTNATTCGAIALALTLFLNKSLSMGKDDVKKYLEKLLSSIVIGEQLDSIVDEIILKIKDQSSIPFDEFKELIKDNLGKDLNDEQLNEIAKFIFEACGLDGEQNKTDGDKNKTDGGDN